ncbi:MAG: UbiA family prenyltransferase [Kiritimatiellaceae bacterium]|nr:UbiA family prenyltransferase [Kiritimatiellaceae bacterium]
MNEASISSSRPLCVDLDGTLVKTDTFAQALLLLIRTRPVTFFATLRRVSAGLAAFKRSVAQEVQLDPAALPFHSGLLAFLKSEHGKGRKLILATASDEIPARAVASHLGFFTDVMASDGIINLKAERKRDALIARFGEKGFDYAGNATDDLPVWESAAGIIAVNPCAKVRRALKNRSAQIFEDRPARLKVWLKALRVHQWTKNILVFLPMLLAHELTTPALYLKATLAFFAFSFAASAIYIFNDLFDLHADQHHPRKKNRPFAAGNLSLLAAAIAAPVLVLAALATARMLPVAFTGVLLIYLVITTLYSWRLKQLALLDVMTLAGLYSIRILAGTAAYGVETSTWLIAFSIFLFFSLALVKRYAELRELSQGNSEAVRARGRGYCKNDLPLLAGFGAGSGCVSVLVFALYINSDKVVQFYKHPAALWLLCPLLLYWIARVWLLASRGELSDDPLDFAARDPQTWLIGALSAAVLILGSM